MHLILIVYNGCKKNSMQTGIKVTTTLHSVDLFHLIYLQIQITQLPKSF